MRVTTGWSLLALGTVAALIVIHQHVWLVRQSYRLNERRAVRDTLQEQVTYLAYDVMRLKAPNHLKAQLTTYDVELTTPRATTSVAPVRDREVPERRWTSQLLHVMTAEAIAEP